MRTLDDAIRDEIKRDSGFAYEFEAAKAEFRLARQLAEARRTRNLSQRALAAIAGMPQSAVARYEKAGRTPTIETLWRFASALNATFTFGPHFDANIVLHAAPPCPAADSSASHEAGSLPAVNAQPKPQRGRNTGVPSKA